MYQKTRNALIALLVAQLTILVMVLAPRLGLPVFALSILLVIAFSVEGVFDNRATRYRLRQRPECYRSWYLTATREWRAKQRAKAKAEYMRRLKEKRE